MPRPTASAGNRRAWRRDRVSASASISVGGAAVQRRRDEIAVVIDSEADQRFELGMRLGRRRARSAGRSSTPCPCRARRQTDEVEQQAEGHGIVAGGHLAAVDVVDRVAELLLDRLIGIFARNCQYSSTALGITPRCRLLALFGSR